MTGVTKSDRLVRSRPVRGCSSKLAARRLAVLLGLAAVFTLPAASGAASPANRVAELRAHDTSLAARERGATQELYSIEAQLVRSRAALAAIAAKRESTQAQLTRVRIELDVAWQSAYVAEERLGSRIRQEVSSCHERAVGTHRQGCNGADPVGNAIFPAAAITGRMDIDDCRDRFAKKCMEIMCAKRCCLHSSPAC